MPEQILIGLLGFIMGMVTAISGGAGVFAIPAMLAMGFPPVNVLALNRTSDLAVLFGALPNYLRSKNINWKIAAIAIFPLGIGSFLGASIVVRFPEDLLKIIMLIGVLVGIFFLLRPVALQEYPVGFAKRTWGVFMLVLVGMWSGALGMAGATFAVLVLVYFYHQSFLQARSTDIVAAFPETAIAVTVLSLASSASLVLLSVMFVSSVVGAWVGSHIAVKHGDGLIRKAMVIIAMLMIVKVLLDFI